MTSHTPGVPLRRPPGVFTPAFLSLSLASFVTYFSVQLLTASLPLYAVRLGASDADLGWMAGVIAIASLVARPWVGQWLDRGGSVAALMLGILAFALSAAGYWLAGSVVMLLVFRALTGLGIALFTTAGQTLTVNLTPQERRGEALSLYAVWHPIALIVGPPAGVAIAGAAGYPVLFAVCITIGLLGLSLTWPLRTLRSGSTGRRPLLINRTVWTPGILMAFLMVPYGANIGLLAVHAVRRGLANPGMTFTAMAVGLLAVLLSVGRRSDRTARTAIVVPGMFVAAFGMWAIATLHGWGLLVGGALSGIGLGLTQPALIALGVDLVPPEDRGSAIATLGMFLEIGIWLGAVGGGLVARSFGTGMMFALAGVAPAAGALLAVTLTRRSQT
jgi:MFS family permease